MLLEPHTTALWLHALAHCSSRTRLPCRSVHSLTSLHRACCRWEAAAPGFKVLLDEAGHICQKEVPKSCGCCNDVMKMKTALDEKWTERASDFLKEYGLTVEVCAFFTSDGKNTSPHLVLQFSKIKTTEPQA